MNNSSSFFNLTLNVRENILNNITIHEVYDINVLDKLINSNLLREKVSNPLSNHNNEKTQLLKYKELYENNYSRVTLKRSSHNYGRCYPENSLSLLSIRKEIRHTLCKNDYKDFDIINCHPTILYQICIANNIRCILLEKYVFDRSYYLEFLKINYGIEYTKGKELFISLLYGANLKNLLNKYANKEATHNNYIKNDKLLIAPILQDFKDEFQNICKIIYDNNPDLVEAIKNKKEDNQESIYNLHGSVCSFFLQEKEVIILEIIYKYCIEKGYIKNNECVLCLDGIMLLNKYIDHVATDRILDELHNIILDKTGFNLSFSNKKMDLDYLNILDNHIIFNLHLQPFSSGMISDYFKMLYGSLFLFSNNKLYYYNNVYWIEDDKTKSKLHTFVDTIFYKKLLYHINKLIDELNSRITTMDKNIFDTELKVLTTFLTSIQALRKGRFRNEIVNDICIKITNNTVVFDANPYLFCFNNKVYNLLSGKFILPSSYQYLKTTCGYDYDTNYPVERTDLLMDLLRKIFPDNETLNFYLISMSTGLSGLQIEKLFILSGMGGNGKSLIDSLAINTLGPYSYKLPSSVLLQDIKDGGNPQIANLHKKRFVCAQEPNDNRRIYASTLKEITGDKKINARLNYSNDCDVDLQLTLVLECNNLPAITEVNDAIIRRIVVIPFISKFVSKEVYDETEDKTNLFLADSYYKTDEFQISYRQAFFNILASKWKDFQTNNFALPSLPKLCKDAIKEYLATSDDIYDWFKSIFEEKEGAYIKVADIYDIFTESTLWTTLSKAEKKKFNKTHFTKKIQENVFLKKYFKEPMKYKINDKYITSPHIIGWQIINN